MCFVFSLTLLALIHIFIIVRPALVLYIFTVLFVLLLAIRIQKYIRKKYCLFLLGICYIVNLISLIFVWYSMYMLNRFLPQSHVLQLIQFGLANGPVIVGGILYRNAFVLHSVEKMTSVFIHALPSLFSFW
ncbi:unnamed protein product [Protopolystoma xenopodis]|uniref:Glycerophosphocholine acyltransferase 1 n=1 Tax=Protopolystoma xenopodis TaxID=117903 RepID=A0A448X5Y1_9PLAT|nr:unnamed protein product [Protopolystoma xenopodis]